VRLQKKLDRSVEMYLALSAQDSDDDDDDSDADMTEVSKRQSLFAQSIGHCMDRQALISSANTMMQSLKPYLGLDIKANPPLGMKVVGIKDQSPAQKAGLLQDDIVQETNSLKTCTGSEFYKVLAHIQPGDTLSFHLLRYSSDPASSSSSSSSKTPPSSPNTLYKRAHSHHVMVEVASTTLSLVQVQRLRRISQGVVICDEQTDDREFLASLSK
jgi:hypothetical protein